ncbi:MAG: ABC transporter ATP-binding protein [Ruminococcaceae bacterium]|nr:ABC transporter ATP-binding protein [Oscillospiraceae bacterium]
MLKRLLSCVGKYKWAAILAPVTIIFEVLLETTIPLYISDIIDTGINGGAGVGYVLQVGGKMVLMALLSMLCGVLAAKFAAVAGTGFACNVRNRVFQKIQDFSFANIDRFSTPSLITRLTTDVNTVQMAFTSSIRMMVRAPIMLIMATYMAVRINAKLSVIFLFAIPILGGSLAIITKHAMPRFKAMFEKYDKLNASIQEMLIAIRVVKAFVRGDHEIEKFEVSAADVQNAQKRAEKLVILNSPIMQFCMYGCMIAVSWFGGMHILNGTMTTGLLMSFISYITQILSSLMMVSFMFIMVVMASTSIKRINEVLDELPDITDENADPALQVADGSIEFDHVYFSYAKRADNLTLTDIDFRIEPGETVGILGGTGSAKSTLVQLIPRLYDVFEGSVKVGGHDVRDYKIENLRENVAMVLQVNNLFAGSIKENLRWGKADATDEEIEAAARAAQAHDFIMSFPDGYDTMLEQGGVNVSGGQKQRLCIARALIKKPKIIILDDSTSAVDVATDAKIRQALQEGLADTTTLIIAQRISSIAGADKIIVMEDGCISAMGTHEELLETSEIYRDVYESQQKGVE